MDILGGKIFGVGWHGGEVHYGGWALENPAHGIFDRIYSLLSSLRTIRQFKKTFIPRKQSA
jgi:hypothetical protein